jgi:hypothetical protein
MILQSDAFVFGSIGQRIRMMRMMKVIAVGRERMWEEVTSGRSGFP